MAPTIYRFLGVVQTNDEPAVEIWGLGYDYVPGDTTVLIHDLAELFYTYGVAVLDRQSWRHEPTGVDIAFIDGRHPLSALNKTRRLTIQ